LRKPIPGHVHPRREDRVVLALQAIRMQPMLEQSMVRLDRRVAGIRANPEDAICIGLREEQDLAHVELRGFPDPRFRFAEGARGFSEFIGRGTGSDPQQAVHAVRQWLLP
jgi:hypothetical protein